MRRIIVAIGQLCLGLAFVLGPALPAAGAIDRACHYCVQGRVATSRDHACTRCAATAVTAPREIDEIALSVRARIASWGLPIAYGTIPVTLVDAATMAELSGQPVHGALGRCHTTGLTAKMTGYRGGRVSSRDVAIQILAGQPREACEATVAHELMHAWSYLDEQPEHAQPLEEGVCNLAGYYIHQEHGTQTARFLREQMFKSPSVAYGEGLRRAIRYVQRHEFAGLVRMMRTHRDFPTGY